MLHSAIRTTATAIAAAAVAAIGLFGGVADAQAFNFTKSADTAELHFVMTPALNYSGGVADFSWGVADFSWGGARKAGG